MTIKNTTLFSFSAHIDLLGFSSHLELAKNDLRTTIGSSAVVRLRILSDVIQMINSERKLHRNEYPSSFRIMRFNDSIIFGMDLPKTVIPEVGEDAFKRRPNLFERYIVSRTNLELSESNSKIDPALVEGAKSLAEFIGIVCRAHNYINQKEKEIHMPGCRTIIASGLRDIFIVNKKEDPYSANFSLANAFKANELGSKSGFFGNRVYMEKNLARICSIDVSICRYIGLIRLVESKSIDDPYDGNKYITWDTKFYEESKEFQVELFRNQYWFREINSQIGSTLQMVHKFNKAIDADDSSDYLRIISKIFKSERLPTITEINSRMKSGIYNQTDYFPIMNQELKLECDLSDYWKLITDK